MLTDPAKFSVSNKPATTTPEVTTLPARDAVFDAVAETDALTPTEAASDCSVEISLRRDPFNCEKFSNMPCRL